MVAEYRRGSKDRIRSKKMFVTFKMTGYPPEDKYWYPVFSWDDPSKAGGRGVVPEVLSLPISEVLANVGTPYILNVPDKEGYVAWVLFSDMDYWSEDFGYSCFRDIRLRPVEKATYEINAINSTINLAEEGKEPTGAGKAKNFLDWILALLPLPPWIGLPVPRIVDKMMSESGVTIFRWKK